MKGRAPEETSGPVEVTATFSPPNDYSMRGSTAGRFNFSYYVGPRLFGVYPNKGPVSGGTRVSLIGENLDFDDSKDRYFIVHGRRCHLEELNTTTAWCVTGNETTQYYSDRIAIVVDDVTYGMEENPTQSFFSNSFEYIPDPEILQLQPGFTTVGGLINVAASGLYLDSVLFPRIVVKVSTSNSTHLEFIEFCWSNPDSNGTELTCATPPLADEPWLRMPTRTSPLLTHVSFIMDGVRSVREFSQHQESRSRLLYYPDPEFETLGEVERIAQDQTPIEIKGKNLFLVNSVNNFQIRLGESDSCKITIVSMELLFCEFTLTNSSSTETNISVQVSMGSVTYHLGYIKFIEMEKNSSPLEYILLSIYIISPFVVIAVVLLCFREIRRKKRKTSNQNETSYGDTIPPVPPRSFDAGAEMPTPDTERKLVLRESRLLIPREHLVIGELIGSGQFGKVFKGLLRIPDQQEMEVAIKTLYRRLWRDPVKTGQFMEEALIMREFDHPHVMCLLGVCFEGSVPHLVLPLMENGDLLNYIRDDNKTLLVSDLLKFAADVASGMCYLSKLKFVHRDLAARNCIVDSSLRVKVADFGLSRDVYERNYYRSRDKHAELPFRWTAPEVIAEKLSTTESDVWSYGVLLWELMTRGSIPYGNVGTWDVLGYIRLGNRLNQPQFCPKPLYLSMLECWNTDPQQRPTFFQLHSHVTELHDDMLNDTVTEVSTSSATVTEISVCFHSVVPAENTLCYNSKALYLSMAGHTLDREDLEDAYMEDFGKAYLSL